jgi:dipeptidyl-peptidase 4
MGWIATVRGHTSGDVPLESTEIMETDAFPRQLARTRRFSLGVPGQFRVSPDGERVLFLRSASGSDPHGRLWLCQDGCEQVLADPAGNGTDQTGGTSAGVTGYATDRDARVVAYVVDGALWTVRTDGGRPRRIPTAGPVTTALPSPDGALVAYATGGACTSCGPTGPATVPWPHPRART